MAISIFPPPEQQHSILDVSRFGVEGWSRSAQFGVIDAQPMGTEQELWNGNDAGAGFGDVILPVSPTVASLVSNDANDTLAGTGAQQVVVQGLDGNLNPIQEIVDMDGVQPVVTTLAFARTYKILTVAAGVLDANAGEITCTVDGNVQELMTPAESRSRSSHFTTPAGKVTQIFSLLPSIAAVNQDGRSLVRFYASNFTTQIEFFVGSIILDTATSPTFEGFPAGPFVLDEATDLRITAENDGTQGITTVISYATVIAPKGTASGPFPPSP